MRKNNGRNALVFEAPVCHAAVEPVCEPASGSNCNRCQRRATGDVAERENVIDIGLLPFVRRNKSFAVAGDTSRIKVERGGVGRAPDGPDHGIEVTEFTAVLGVQPKTTVGLS